MNVFKLWREHNSPKRKISSRFRPRLEPLERRDVMSTIWGDSAVPTITSANDSNAVELGVKFHSDQAGYITGVRFYKGEDNTGPHVGHLWSIAGQLMGTATFSGETDSGWQEADFASPVAIAAGTAYVASYYAPNGHYAADQGAFSLGGAGRGPLHALADGANGPDGVFLYGKDAFPDQSYLSTNYWVDAVFTSTPPAQTAPVVVTQAPLPDAVEAPLSTTPSVTFNEQVSADSLVFNLLDSAGNSVPTTLSYDGGTHTATFTPTVALAESATYTATLSAATDLNGNGLAAPVSWSFTTDPPAEGVSTIWGASAVPTQTSINDPSAVELGVKFSSDQSGYVTGVRFYKGDGNTGGHFGHLWTSSGQLLATATFSDETSSGWQEASFDSPVAITAGTTYVVSYYAPNGHYAEDDGAFAFGEVGNGPLHALADDEDGPNGVYFYGADAFPTQGYLSTNYWVDALFTSAAPAGLTPTVVSQTPAPNATGVVASGSVSVTFNESMLASSIVFTLNDSAGNAVTGTMSYDDNTHTATLTPSSPLALSTTYAVSLSGTTDAAGNVLAPVTWSFTTGSGPWQQSTVADFDTGTTNGIVVTNDAGGELQLGGGFTEDFSGTTLSSAWAKSAWVSGGGATLSGSVLSVTAAEVMSTQSFSNVAIEASLNFTGAAYQHFGLATDLGSVSGNSWAIFSTMGTSNTLFARVNSNGVTTDVNLGALPVGFHVYRVQPMPAVYQFYVDGVLKTTIAATFPSTTDLRIALSSYSATGPALQADWIRQVGGTYTSAVFDATRTATWGMVNWTATYPPGTILVVETRSGNTATPDASWSDWIMAYNAGDLLSPDSRYLQYRVTLYTSDPTTSEATLTPVLSDVTFNWV